MQPLPETKTETMTRLDRFALFAIAATAVLIAWTLQVQFLRWGLVGSAVLVIRACMTNRRDLMALAVVMPAFVCFRLLALRWVTWLTPQTVDATLSRTDLGFSVACYTWFSSHSALAAAISLVYGILPFWIALVMAFAPHPWHLLRAMVIATVAAVPGYLFCPAVGPAWIDSVNAPRTCMPSLHLAWALLVFLYCSSSFRSATAIFLALTALATIATGEHYIIDLVVAVPFTFGVVWLEQKVQAVRFFEQTKSACQ